MKLDQEDIEDIIALLESAAWDGWESRILAQILIEKLGKEIEL